MPYTTDEARRQMLDDLAHAIDEIGVALAALGAAYELLDEQSGDRLEAELFRPVQVTYGRAQRTHASFAERHRLPAPTLEPARAPPGELGGAPRAARGPLRARHGRPRGRGWPRAARGRRRGDRGDGPPAGGDPGLDDARRGGRRPAACGPRRGARAGRAAARARPSAHARAGPLTRASRPGAAAAAVSRKPGSRRRTVVPSTGLLATETEPPCASTMAFTIGSPRPVPPASWGRRTKRSKTRGSASSGMPTPWSIPSKAAAPAEAPPRPPPRSPGPVALTAFSITASSAQTSRSSSA